jgi:Rrf2 family cysteine metabolism transcriptional repressor
MRITTRSRYGLRALLYLARRPEPGPAPLSEIAGAEEIPQAFLERILAQLRDAGLVRTTRGAAGGYELARPPAAISAADVVGILENPRPMVDCLEQPDACERIAVCRARPAWRRLDEAITGALASVTIEDLNREEIQR